MTQEASVDNVDFSPDEVVLGEGGFMKGKPAITNHLGGKLGFPD